MILKNNLILKNKLILKSKLILKVYNHLVYKLNMIIKNISIKIKHKWNIIINRQLKISQNINQIQLNLYNHQNKKDKWVYPSY